MNIIQDETQMEFIILEHWSNGKDLKHRIVWKMHYQRYHILAASERARHLTRSQGLLPFVSRRVGN